MKKTDASIIKKAASQPALFLFLDYDGTLTPIASGPSKARLSRHVRSLLRELRSMKGVKIAIVSGRSLRNLKRYVRIPGVILAGNHGFEVHGAGISYIHPEALTQERLFRELARRLKRELAPFRGFFVEHKTFSLSVHYRHVRSLRVIQIARRILVKRLSSLEHTPIELRDGKKVWEIRPTADWHKGKTVAWLLARFGRNKRRPFPVYIGDDVTDEDAFRVIRRKGIGIKVLSEKRCRSHARYFVRSSGEAVRFLRKLLALRKDGNRSDA